MTVQINSSMQEEDADKLDELARCSGLDNRSAYIRLLIRQEWARRHTTDATPVPEGENNGSAHNH